MSIAFISYAKEDLAEARDVYDYLVRDGYSAWLDEKDLLPGHDWQREIGKAIRSCEVFIACLSRTSVSKRGVFQKELKQAFDILSELPDDHVFLIPVRFDDCAIPDRLRSIHYLDWFRKDDRHRLLQSISLRSRVGIDEKDKFVILQGLLTLKSKTYYVYPHLREGVQGKMDQKMGSRISQTTLDEVRPILEMLRQKRLLEFSLASESGEGLGLRPITLERVDKVYLRCIDIASLKPLIQIVDSIETKGPELWHPG